MGNQKFTNGDKVFLTIDDSYCNLKRGVYSFIEYNQATVGNLDEPLCSEVWLSYIGSEGQRKCVETSTLILLTRHVE